MISRSSPTSPTIDREEDLDKNLPGATITSIGSIYAQAVFGEDHILRGML